MLARSARLVCVSLAVARAEILSAMVQEEMNEPHALWANIPRHLFETAKVLLDV